VASPEWGGQVWKQQAILAATSDDTVQTSVYDRLLDRPFPAGITDRVVRNPFVARWGNAPEADPGNTQLLEQLLRGRERGDTAIAGVSAGVSSGLIAAMQPAADIVHTIVREAEDLLRQRPRQLLGS
jgi:nitronate monooxygenase